MSVVYGLIVVGTDNSADADSAVEFAAELARSARAPLHIVAMHHSYPDTFYGARLRAAYAMGYFEGFRWMNEPTEERIVEIHRAHIDRYANRLRRAGIDVSTHVVSGDPANRLNDLAVDLGADLVVVGTHDLKSGQADGEHMSSGADAWVLTIDDGLVTILVRAPTDAQALELANTLHRIG